MNDLLARLAGSAPPESPAPEEEASERRRLVLFRVGGRVHAVELGAVREVIPSRRTTRLPGAPAHVAGLINVRGTIVTVIDLAMRLAGRPADAAGSTILVEHGTKLVGVAVDEVLEVRSFTADAIEPAGPASGGADAVVGTGHFGDSIVILLDVHALVGEVLL